MASHLFPCLQAYHPAFLSLKVNVPNAAQEVLLLVSDSSLAPTHSRIKFKFLSQAFKGLVPIFLSNPALC